MIYTLTLNPSIDYIVDSPELKIGATNRATAEQMRAGGKGINVSIMLKNLGLPSVALGFVAGFTGEEIIRAVHELGIEERFIRLKKGSSRINIKLRTSCETEVNGVGPEVTEEDLELLMGQLTELKEGDILIISGSAPAGLGKNIYADILDRIRENKVKVAVDASGELLINALPYSPFLVKPNEHEISAVTGIDPEGGYEELIKGAKQLQAMGAINVLVSAGSKGAVMLDPDGRSYIQKAPVIDTVNTVGAGDSMVAGFISAYLRGASPAEICCVAVAAGSASAAQEGFASREDVLRLQRLL